MNPQHTDGSEAAYATVAGIIIAATLLGLFYGLDKLYDIFVVQRLPDSAGF